MANPPPKPLTEVVEAVANRHQEAGYLPSTGDNLPSTAENASGEFENSSRNSIFGEEGVRRTENAVQLLENRSTAKQMTADGKDAKAIKQPRFISRNTIG